MKRFTFWSRQGIKGPTLFEYLWGFVTIPYQEHCLKLYGKYGQVYGAYGLMTKSLILNKPELIREVFVKSADIFQDRIHWNFNNYADQMMIVMPGDQKWKRIRCALTPAFTSKKLKAMLSQIIKISDKLVQSIEIQGKISNHKSSFIHSFARYNI